MIYALHGIIDSKSQTEMGHRNLVQTDRLRQFIAENRNAIGTTQDVVKGRKDIAFTIDDGTKASYDTAILFAELGVPCTWFVNGKNIVEDIPYSFAYLNELLERCNNEIVFNDEVYRLDNFYKKKKIRKVIKEFMHQNFPTDVQRIQFMHEVIAANGIKDFEIPLYARHVNLNDMLSMKGSSVSVMNHLWEHNFTDLDDKDALMDNIRKGADWLQAYFDYPINEHALPYGLYSDTLRNLTSDIIYLLDNRHEVGVVLPNVLNRNAF